MPLQFISADRTTQLSLGADYDRAIILPDVVLTFESSAIVGHGEYQEVTNFGTVLGGSFGIYMNGEQPGGFVANEAGGIVYGGLCGIAMSAAGHVRNAGSVSSGDDGSGVAISGDYTVLHNLSGGLISGGSSGVSSDGAQTSILNDGSITGNLYALQITGASTRIDNSGIIHGSTDYGVMITSNFASLTNSGEISGGVKGIYLETSNGQTNIKNSGILEGLTDVSNGVIGSTLYLTNTGTITGAVYVAYKSSLKLRNSGEIEDVIWCGSAADLVRNSGTILDDVVLGDGADTFNGRGGSVLDEVLGGLGDDVLIAGDGDTVKGEFGNDLLRGGGSQNWLNGGRGVDRLLGGAGSDTFVFENKLDSGATNATSDRIGFFDRNLDTIDLELVDANTVASGNQEFTFIGTAAFGNVAGQLRVVNAGTNVFLQADMDGNGTSDFQIILGGLSGQAAQFVAQDFVL